MEWKLELVVLPVADVDRAKAFYLDRAGFDLIVDHRAGEEFRVVQVTPRGSACAVALMANHDAAGSVRGLHLVVSDIDAARDELTAPGVEASELFHFDAGAQVPGPTRNARTTGHSCRSVIRTATAGSSRRSDADSRQRGREAGLEDDVRVVRVVRPRVTFDSFWPWHAHAHFTWLSRHGSCPPIRQNDDTY